MVKVGKCALIYIIMEEIVSVSENNEIIGLRNFHRLLFGFRLQTQPPVNHPGTATTTTTEKFEIADIGKLCTASHDLSIIIESKFNGGFRFSISLRTSSAILIT